jgi:hypothetical protein
MTLYSQYIYSLVLYTVNNEHLFDTNNEIHNYKTRNNNNLHLPFANLSKFNKGAYISGIKVFNHLPQYINLLKTKRNLLYVRNQYRAVNTFHHGYKNQSVNDVYSKGRCLF